MLSVGTVSAISGLLPAGLFALRAKMVVLYGIPRDMKGFEEHYRNVHLPLASKIKGIRGAALARVTDGLHGPAPYYRMAEVYFDDMKGLREALESKEGKAAIEDMKAMATGGVTVFFAEER